MNLLRESSFTKDTYETGERHGKIEQTMKIVILLGEVRFGPIDDSTLATIESIDDLERLEGLCEKLLHATSWADLMTESRNTSTLTPRNGVRSKKSRSF